MFCEPYNYNIVPRALQYTVQHNDGHFTWYLSDEDADNVYDAMSTDVAILYDTRDQALAALRKLMTRKFAGDIAGRVGIACNEVNL